MGWSIGKVFSNPVRAVAAVATGGASELYLKGARELAKRAQPDMPVAEEMPTAPSPDDPATLAKLETAMRIERDKARKGRASTILAGNSLGTTLDPSEGVARRTLMGS